MATVESLQVGVIDRLQVGKFDTKFLCEVAAILESRREVVLAVGAAALEYLKNLKPAGQTRFFVQRSGPAGLNGHRVQKLAAIQCVEELDHVLATVVQVSNFVVQIAAKKFLILNVFKADI